jgi:hypothetical protein
MRHQTEIIKLRQRKGSELVQTMILAYDETTNEIVYNYLSWLSHTEIPVHFYALSDRKINDGDWFFDGIGVRQKVKSKIHQLPSGCRKIEATTHEALIEKNKELLQIKLSDLRKYFSGCVQSAEINITQEGFIETWGSPFVRMYFKEISPEQVIKNKVQAIYNKHSVFLNNMKQNRSEDIENKMFSGAELKHYNEQIETLAAVLGDIYREILYEENPVTEKA